MSGHGESMDPQDRMYLGLLLIGYSWHTGMKRFGDKAHAARWALGAEDSLPASYEDLIQNREEDPSGIEHIEGLLDSVSG